jgi:hypothetical protein
MMLKDLEKFYDIPLSKGDSIYLIRKISEHVVETRLECVNEGGKPSADVEWDMQHRYRLDLTSGKVAALNATQRHRQEMLAWYTLWEPQRIDLLYQFHSLKKKVKSRRSFGIL